MNLYLYIIVNNHPEVKKRYKYLVLANSKSEAITKMRNADGKSLDTDVIESCELIHSVENNIWYLPHYIPESVK